MKVSLVWEISPVKVRLNPDKVEEEHNEMECGDMSEMEDLRDLHLKMIENENLNL